MRLWFEHLRHDLHTALRAVARRRLASGAAILALAIGMGGPASVLAIFLAWSTAVFPGVRDPQQLVMVSETAPREPGRRRDATAETVRVWRANAGMVQQLSMVQPPVIVNFSAGDLPEPVRVMPIGVDLLPLLGVSAAKGRAFSATDDDGTAEPVVVASHGFVERRFAGRPDVVGSVIDLDGRRVTIVGVLPVGFWFNSRDVDLWVPIAERDADPSAQYRVVARLRPGDDAEAITARFAALAPQVAAAQPARDPGWGVRVESMGARQVFGGNVPPGILMMVTAAALGLLAACANIAMLMVARGVARQKETAVRAALGAGRLRLVREFLAESLVVSFAGGMAALFVVYAASRLIIANAPADVVAGLGTVVDWRVAAGVLLVSFAVGVLSGLAPALSDSRVHLVAALKETGYFGGAPARSRVRRVLIVAEVSITLMLMANIGLLMRGIIEHGRTPPGFDPNNLISLQLNPVQHLGRAATPAPAMDAVLERIAALPGVQSVAVARIAVPFTPINSVSENYFRTLGIRLLDGRTFNAADRSAGTVVVSEAFARQRFAGRRAIGQTIRVGAEPAAREIVGIVSDVLTGPVRREANPVLYVPYVSPASSDPRLTVVVRTLPGANVIGDIRRAIAAMDPGQTVTSVQNIKEVLEVGAQEVRVSVYMVAPILILAMLLAMTGIYGLLAQTVAQRTHEYAVRVALGAGGKDLLRLVLAQGVKLAGGGAAVGAAGALMLDRALGSFLFGLPAEQWLALAGSALLILAVTLLASIAPCRRAVRVDPGRTLKYE